MMVEIDDDCADEILVASLADSYIYLSECLKDPESWHEDDVDAWRELLPAIMIVGNWYSIDFKSVIKKMKKRK